MCPLHICHKAPPFLKILKALVKILLTVTEVGKSQRVMCEKFKGAVSFITCLWITFPSFIHIFFVMINGQVYSNNFELSSVAGS